MAKRKPTILSTETIYPTASIVFQADADILDFSGHFNNFPILPGVTQIDWALHFAVELLKTPSAFKGMEVIKFQEPILPDSTLCLSLSWDEEKQKLTFKYSSTREQDDIIHSSGKMKLGAPSE
ncbi:3-hydroxyacyl-ACP dehydratase [Vibrio sp. ZSDE26]|uniref:3-hydroxyacyl-ACP dehydratase n=1 Tax=Vibrio amylolyticus TaxID=2847292 RepID=A0A9X2BKD1_9VIBR|nr:3-hydroxyacyl-ACP dehydratase [Vibrio amylolyticus]MCK6264367.1 3-hydroxyacyl-ACP dehydratase [Vibrio amylolyticus]